jgi:mannose-6-phosphate isomerase-like protein (cupin superfamily)
MDIRNVNDSTEFKEETLTKRLIFQNEQQLCFVLNLKAGQSLPTHKHEHSTLVMLVLSGTGEVKVNQETETIMKGSIVRAQGTDDFEIPQVSEDMSLFVTLSPNPSNQMYSKEHG